MLRKRNEQQRAQELWFPSLKKPPPFFFIPDNEFSHRLGAAKLL
jgi:hypothetical protein